MGTIGLRMNSRISGKDILNQIAFQILSLRGLTMAESSSEQPGGFDPTNMDVEQIKEMLKGMNVDFDKENLNIEEIAASIVQNALKDSGLGGGGGGGGMQIAGYAFGGELHYVFLWALPLALIIGFFIYRLISSQRRKQLEKEEKKRKKEEKKKK